MGVIKALFKTAVYGAATTVATFAVLTRKSEFPPVTAAAEELFKSELYKRLNPDGNTPLYDVCVRRVRLDKIRPELRNEPEALVTAFCAGIWSGNGNDAFTLGSGGCG